MSDQLDKVAITCLAAGKRAMNRELTLKEFRDLWPLEADKDRLLWRYMHAVEHFLIDVEIRAKDAAYEKSQKTSVRLLASKVFKKYAT